MRLRTELFADRIPPDVGRDILDGIGRAKDVIIVACLPETTTVQFFEFEGGALLEKADEFAEVTSVLDSLSKDMYVIRHEAVGVEKKRVACGAFEKEMEDPLGGFCISEMRRTVVTTNCDEIRLPAKVIFGG
jgi:hypothetical protein